MSCSKSKGTKGGGGGGASGAWSLVFAPGGSFAFHLLRSTTRRAGRLLLPRRSMLHSMRVMGMKTSGIAPSTDPMLIPPRVRRESEDEVDLRRYCIYRQLYDDQFMLGCEKALAFALTIVLGIQMLMGRSSCDNWFHPNWKSTSVICSSTFIVNRVSEVR